MDVVIREALPEELLAVGRLGVEVYGDEGLSTVGYLPVIRDAAARAAAPLTEVLVAVDPARSRMLGSLTFCQFGSPFADVAERDEGEVRMLAVRGSVRRSGIGEALMRHTVERARRLSCHRVVLSTKPAMVTAQRMYERLGFRRVPDRDLVGSVSMLAYALDL